MIGESGSKNFGSTFGDIDILRHRCPDVLHHHHSLITGIFRKIWIQYLCVSHRDLRRRCKTAEFDFWNTHHVLPHIINEYPFSHFLNRFCWEFTDRKYGVFILPHQFEKAIIIGSHCRAPSVMAYMSGQRDFNTISPFSGIIRRKRPSFYITLTASIIYFSLEKTSVSHRTFIVTLPPRRRSYNILAAAILISDI